MWDIAIFAGTIGLFLTLLLLFIRYVPMIAVFELKMLLYDQKHKAHGK